MFVSKNLGVNEKGHLTVSGVDTVDIAKNYTTPLYIMDDELIRENCRSFKNSIDKYYNGNGMVCYASKAFCCKEMCRIIFDEKLGLDVVSSGELFTAISANFPAERICFHGNNKTDNELTLAISHGVGRIVVDNLEELERLNRLCGKLHKKVSIMFRLKPGIEAHTHSAVQTGQIDSKFGFALETGEAFEAIKKAIALENVNLKGLHCHIGSQIFDIDPFVEAAKIMLGFIAKIKAELSYIISDLNLGGGFGIKYTQSDDPVPYDNYMATVSETIKNTCKELSLDLPYIIIEPGRSIVGPAGITLYTVGSVKEIPGIRTYVAVDGGMCDNPRYALYESEYEAIVANKANEAKDSVVTIAGRCCESGDLIGKDIKIQHAECGDIIAVQATGAYNYSMSSNYNRVQRPAVVLISKGASKIIVKRESLEDIIRNDM